MTRSPRLFESKVGNTQRFSAHGRFTLDGSDYAILYLNDDPDQLVLTVPVQRGVWCEVLGTQGQEFTRQQLSAVLSVLHTKS